METYNERCKKKYCWHWRAFNLSEETLTGEPVSQIEESEARALPDFIKGRNEGIYNMIKLVLKITSSPQELASFIKFLQELDFELKQGDSEDMADILRVLKNNDFNGYVPKSPNYRPRDLPEMQAIPPSSPKNVPRDLPEMQVSPPTSPENVPRDLPMQTSPPISPSWGPFDDVDFIEAAQKADQKADQEKFDARKKRKDLAEKKAAEDLPAVAGRTTRLQDKREKIGDYIHNVMVDHGLEYYQTLSSKLKPREFIPCVSLLFSSSDLSLAL